jgi:serine/threonine protein kinase
VRHRNGSTPTANPTQVHFMFKSCAQALLPCFYPRPDHNKDDSAELTQQNEAPLPEQSGASSLPSRRNDGGGARAKSLRSQASQHTSPANVGNTSPIDLTEAPADTARPNRPVLPALRTAVARVALEPGEMHGEVLSPSDALGHYIRLLTGAASSAHNSSRTSSMHRSRQSSLSNRFIGSGRGLMRDLVHSKTSIASGLPAERTSHWPGGTPPQIISRGPSQQSANPGAGFLVPARNSSHRTSTTGEESGDDDFWNVAPSAITAQNNLAPPVISRGASRQSKEASSTGSRSSLRRNRPGKNARPSHLRLEAVRLSQDMPPVGIDVAPSPLSGIALQFSNVPFGPRTKWKTSKPENFNGEWRNITFNVDDLNQPIGTGSFSVVYAVMANDGNGDIRCAVKKFKPGLAYVGKAEASICSDILMKMGNFNDHIVRYYGAVRKTFSAASGSQSTIEIADDDEFMIMSEWVDGPNIDKLIKYGLADFSVSDKLMLAKKIIRDILSGLSALAHANCAHNDLKPDNVLLNVKTLTCKLADFSNSATFGSPAPFGNPLYCGPERIGSIPTAGRPIKPVVQRALRPHEERDIATFGRGTFAQFQNPVSASTDIYALGQILYYLVEGVPFSPLGSLAKQQGDVVDAVSIMMGTITAWVSDQQSQNKITEIIKDDARTDAAKVSEGFYDFINRAMNPDHALRPTADELLNELFLTANYPDDEKVKELVTRCMANIRAAEQERKS